MKNSEAMRLGIVLERRDIDHPWQSHVWRPVAVVPGAAPADGLHRMREEPGRARFLAGTLTVSLFPRETEAYRYNLSQENPAVYVVLRGADGLPDEPPRPFHATVSPDEAQEYLETGEEIVEGVAMPAAVAAWVGDFVARHHVEQPFEKRERKRKVSGGFRDAPSGGGGRP